MSHAHHFEVTTAEGATLSAQIAGEGPLTLLLVSGLGGTASFWDGAAAALERGARVLRFDQRGIGASSRGSAEVTIERLARDCLSVLDAAGTERCVMLGHSTGGCIGQTMARLAPARVSGLVLSASWLGPSRYMEALFRSRRTLLAADPAAYAASAVLLAYPPPWLEANWSVYEAAVAKAPSTDAAVAIVRERIDALLAFDGRAQVGSLTMPTLVLGAEDDMIVPAFLQRQLADALPHATAIALGGGGHFFPQTRPEAFVAALTDWMDRL